MRGIPVDCALGFLECADDETITCRVRALALEKARGHDARPEHCACRGLLDDFLQGGIVVAEVTDGGHTRGEIQASFPSADMTVHVKESRQQHTPTGIERASGLDMIH